MTDITLRFLLAMLAVSSGSSLIVLWILSVFSPGKSGARHAPAAADMQNVFLFQRDTLIDHDAAGTASDDIEEIESWFDLRNWLSTQFPDLPETLKAAKALTYRSAPEAPGLPRSDLAIEPAGDKTRVTLSVPKPPSAVAWHATHGRAGRAAQAEEILDHAPCPIWKTDAAQRVIWSNAPFDDIRDALQPLDSRAGDRRRRRIAIPGETPDHQDWYEITTHGDSPDGSALHYAMNINEVIRAETTRRDFVQTLTKTFANLTTGLAIFDRDRRLQLFNPALVELTGVPIGFLSARPDVIRFFDELRERHVLPEPKSYADLRAHIRELIARASDDSYRETWSLPGGITYRVSGRPHPDGAVAFLFEDISAEMTKTRQFRTQIDLGQSVIDGLEDAIVVLTASNLVMLCNRACSELIGIDPNSSFADMTAPDLIRACRDRFLVAEGWHGFEDMLLETAPEAPGTPNRLLVAKSGLHLHYRVKILAGGVRLVSFHRLPQPQLTAVAAPAR